MGECNHGVSTSVHGHVKAYSNIRKKNIKCSFHGKKKTGLGTLSA